MIKVGVTGGIGSGKTTFCKKLEKLGAYVLYADDFAKELMVSDNGLVESIKNTFGEEAYHTDGSLNRQFLAEEAFAKGRVEELNKLVHPVLWQRADQLIKEKEEEGVEVFIKEAAILLNDGRPEDLDYIILILADEQERINRSVERDQSDPEKVKNRIKKQIDFNQKKELADFIISNNGTLEALEAEAERIFGLLK